MKYIQRHSNEEQRVIQTYNESNPLGCLVAIVVLVFCLYTMSQTGNMKKEFDRRYTPKTEIKK